MAPSVSVITLGFRPMLTELIVVTAVPPPVVDPVDQPTRALDPYGSPLTVSEPASATGRVSRRPKPAGPFPTR